MVSKQKQQISEVATAHPVYLEGCPCNSNIPLLYVYTSTTGNTIHHSPGPSWPLWAPCVVGVATLTVHAHYLDFELCTLRDI